MRIFFDTNVLVSAFLSEKNFCFKLVDEVIDLGAFVTGEVVLTELERALLKNAKIAPDDVRGFLADLRELEIAPAPTHPSSVHVRDPDDALVLASALMAKADILVTGDQDLLTLGKVENLRIMSPRELSELLASEQE
ncbi:MAG: putative toxin-antitoxin system toxin component, PIN family [Nitrospinae bacterium]|nr:putative toxin-antitoxin system toxin component, PIN family [Nitrospinota bacterium]